MKRYKPTSTVSTKSINQQHQPRGIPPFTRTGAPPLYRKEYISGGGSDLDHDINKKQSGGYKMKFFDFLLTMLDIVVTFFGVLAILFIIVMYLDYLKMKQIDEDNK